MSSDSARAARSGHHRLSPSGAIVLRPLALLPPCRLTLLPAVPSRPLAILHLRPLAMLPFVMLCLASFRLPSAFLSCSLVARLTTLPSYHLTDSLALLLPSSLAAALPPCPRAGLFFCRFVILPRLVCRLASSRLADAWPPCPLSRLPSWAAPSALLPACPLPLCQCACFELVEI